MRTYSILKPREEAAWDREVLISWKGHQCCNLWGVLTRRGTINDAAGFSACHIFLFSLSGLFIHFYLSLQLSYLCCRCLFFISLHSLGAHTFLQCAHRLVFVPHRNATKFPSSYIACGEFRIVCPGYGWLKTEGVNFYYVRTPFGNSGLGTASHNVGGTIVSLNTDRYSYLCLIFVYLILSGSIFVG